MTDGTWSGTYYELAMEVSAAPDDERLRAAVERLWSAPGVTGGAAMPPVERGEMAHAYGSLAIPTLGSVPCVSWIVREQRDGSDWLDLCLSTGWLARFGLSWPLVSETPRTLLDALERALLDVAVYVYSGAPFLFAAIGEEVSGMWSSATLTAGELATGGFLLPQPLAARLGAESRAREIAPRLFWIETAGSG